MADKSEYSIPGFDEAVQDVIATMASECQVSKIADGKFIVGMFDSRAVAQRVADALAKCDENLMIEVSELKSEVIEDEE